MEPEEIKQKLESSFYPYRCVVEIWDYDERIRFRVFDQHVPIITIASIELAQINSEPQLSSFITQIKDEIKRKKYPIAGKGTGERGRIYFYFCSVPNIFMLRIWSNKSLKLTLKTPPIFCGSMKLRGGVFKAA